MGIINQHILNFNESSQDNTYSRFCISNFSISNFFLGQKVCT